MPVYTKFEPSQERFHGKLPSRSVVDGSCTIDSKNELPLINVQTALNLFYDLEVLSPTRCENPAKVPLVVVIKECGFCQTPHSKHFTKLLPSQPKAPGAKSGVKCAWWAGFRPHQVRKPGKSAPGGSYQRMWILSNTSFKASYKIFAESAESTRCEIGGKVRLVGRF